MWCWLFGHKWQTILEQPTEGYYTFCERCLKPQGQSDRMRKMHRETLDRLNGPIIRYGEDRYGSP